MSDSKRVRTRAFPGLDANLGPARPLTSVDSEWLIEQVVDRAIEPEKRRSLPFSLRTLSLAAIVVVTSAAAATLVHQKVQRNAAATGTAVTAPQRQNRKPAPRRAPPERASDPNEGTVANSPSIPSAAAAPSSDVPSRTREVAIIGVSAASATLRAQEVAIVDELSAANELRRKSQWQTAEAAYRAIAARYPRAPEAAVAQLAAAELRLEHLGDAAGALQLYQSVSRGSALGVEALFGVSRAYRALGNSEAEAAALRSLVDAFPTSLQADGAHARLKQLAENSTHP